MKVPSTPLDGPSDKCRRCGCWSRSTGCCKAIPSAIAPTLLPCAHCGSATAPHVFRSDEDPDLDEYERDHGHPISWMVVCDAGTDRKRGGCGGSAGAGFTEAEAIEKWNRRITPSQSGDSQKGNDRSQSENTPSSIAPTDDEIIAADLASIRTEDLRTAEGWVLGVVRRAVAHLRARSATRAKNCQWPECNCDMLSRNNCGVKS